LDIGSGIKVQASGVGQGPSWVRLWKAHAWWHPDAL